MIGEALRPHPFGWKMSDAEERRSRTSQNGKSVGCYGKLGRLCIGCKSPIRTTPKLAEDLMTKRQRLIQQYLTYGDRCL